VSQGEEARRSEDNWRLHQARAPAQTVRGGRRKEKEELGNLGRLTVRPQSQARWHGQDGEELRDGNERPREGMGGAGGNSVGSKPLQTAELETSVYFSGRSLL